MHYKKSVACSYFAIIIAL